MSNRLIRQKIVFYPENGVQIKFFLNTNWFFICLPDEEISNGMTWISEYLRDEKVILILKSNW